MKKTIEGLRKAAGLNQTELAKKAGMSGNFISKLENNKRRLTFSAARKIGEVLNEDPFVLQKTHTVQSLEEVFDRLEYRKEKGFHLKTETENLLTAFRLINFLVDTIYTGIQDTTFPEANPTKESVQERSNEVWENGHEILGNYLDKFLEATQWYVERYHMMKNSNGSQ